MAVKKYSTSLFLIGIAFIFFLLRLPSLVEPYWYGDEGIYEVIGTALRQGRMLYTGIWDNKPPLLYLIYALFSGNQESVRFFSLIVGLATVLLFYILAKKTLQQKIPVFLATSFFAVLFATPYLEGNIANAENFMILPAIGAGILVLQAVDKRRKTGTTWKTFLLAGLLLGLSFLIKIVAIFDLAAFMFFFFLATFTDLHNVKKYIAPYSGLIGGFLLPIIATCLLTFTTGTFSTFIHSAFLSNVGYVGYGNYFLFPQGLLVTKLLLLAAMCLFFFWKRHSTQQAMLFILTWLGFSLFSALFSQRPYTHYLLVLLASFSLYIGLIFTETNIRKYLIGGLIVVLFIIYGFADFRPQFIKSIKYYGNFISFTFGNKSVDDYLGFFDKTTVRDYKLAEYITAHKKPTTTLFVWGNDGQLYKLTNTLPAGRYIVAYHISSSQQTWNETAQILKAQQPTFVVVSPKQGPIPYSLQGYTVKLMIDGVALYEKVF